MSGNAPNPRISISKGEKSFKAEAKALQLHKTLKHTVSDCNRKEAKLRSIVVHVTAENKELQRQVDALLAAHASVEARATLTNDDVTWDSRLASEDFYTESSTC